MTATEPPRTDGEEGAGAPGNGSPGSGSPGNGGSGNGGSGEPVPSGQPSLPPRAEAVVRRRRVESRQKKITWWQVGTTVVFIALLVGLSWVGYQSALKVGGGSNDRVTDPTEPGYLAEPRPTAVDMYVVTEADGSFASALMVVPNETEEGGTLVPLPPSFIVPEYEGAPPEFVSTIYDEGGPDGFRERMGIALGFQVDSVQEIPAAAVEQLAGGTAIEVDNVEDLATRLPDGTLEVQYPSGPIALEPAAIVDFLAFEGADDPAPNQAIRATEVWEALLANAAGSTHESLPVGAVSEGADSPPFGSAVDALNAGEVRYDAVPMDDVQVPDSFFVAWMPDPTSLNKFVARVVPLPTSPAPGLRPSTAILNGTSDADALTAMVPVVVQSGGAVTLVGNADSLDVATTTVEWLSPDGELVAEAIASELGTTATEASPDAGDGLGGASVLVVLGSDRTT